MDSEQRAPPTKGRLEWRVSRSTQFLSTAYLYDMESRRKRYREVGRAPRIGRPPARWLIGGRRYPIRGRPSPNWIAYPPISSFYAHRPTQILPSIHYPIYHTLSPATWRRRYDENQYQRTNTNQRNRRDDPKTKESVSDIPTGWISSFGVAQFRYLPPPLLPYIVWFYRRCWRNVIAFPIFRTLPLQVWIASYRTCLWAESDMSIYPYRFCSY